MTALKVTTVEDIIAEKLREHMRDQRERLIREGCPEDIADAALDACQEVFTKDVIGQYRRLRAGQPSGRMQ